MTTNDRIIRLPEVKSITGLGRSSIYAFERDGSFPKRIPIGARSVGWSLSEVLKWIDKKVKSDRSLSREVPKVAGLRRTERDNKLIKLGIAMCFASLTEELLKGNSADAFLKNIKDYDLEYIVNEVFEGR